MASNLHLDAFANASLLDARFTSSIIPGQTGRIPAYAPHGVFKEGITAREDDRYKVSLVVDTVGFNDKTWLDQMGHPHTDKLHLTERYKRVDANTLELDMTIDDPGAYTKPWYAHRNFTISKSGQWYQWICTVEENQHFFDNQGAPAVSSPPNK